MATKIRFRTEPGQATNLLVKVYSLDSMQVLGSYSTGITELAAETGYYELVTSDTLTGSWFVSVSLYDTGEVAVDGFASPSSRELADTPEVSTETTAIAAAVLSGLSAVEPKVVRNYDPRKRRITITRANDVSVDIGSQVDVAVNLPQGVDGASCTATFAARMKRNPSKAIGPVAATLVLLGGIWHVRIQLSKAETTVDAGDWEWDAKVSKSAKEVTVIKGELEIAQNFA